ncbi:NYN domain-containing protein [Aquihabitans daechungensis]|uniref:NYN domain-containing protein n=1 Tax=Aquihabitans daechungensis TaxID=1052257 RepID=UPI003B9FCE6C
MQARSGGRVVVVFDGDDAVSAPKASKNVRVQFSATGQTADDAIVDLLATTPLETPVIVVSSDRAVAADARRQGAVAIGSRPFLTAAGR